MMMIMYLGRNFQKCSKDMRKNILIKEAKDTWSNGNVYLILEYENSTS